MKAVTKLMVCLPVLWMAVVRMKVLVVVLTVQLLVAVQLGRGWYVRQKVGLQVLRSVVILIVHLRVRHGVGLVPLVQRIVGWEVLHVVTGAVCMVQQTNRQRQRAMVVHQ